MKTLQFASSIATAGAIMLSMVAFSPGAALASVEGEPPAPSAITSVKDATAEPWFAKLSGPQQVVVELTDEPAALTYAQATQEQGLSAPEATSAVQAQLARIETAQVALASQLDALGAQVLYRVQRAYNGIAVKVDASRLSAVQSLPGVKAVHRLVTKYLDNSSSVPLIGAPELWSAGWLNVTGEGIKIGIIDTGIDYLHADFGGFGAITPSLYLSNDTTIIRDVIGFPADYGGVKVVGGWDFVGDAYTGSNTPVPDPDPMDCNGHGSHVSGSAAGYGVTGAGATYTGPYNAGIDFKSFRIGPGVAPRALLYGLRVFGCAGNSNVVLQAIDWAIDPDGNGDFSDHLDVINMSLGSDFGGNYDADAVASDNASLAGVIVVAAAGNPGDTFYSVGSPSTANRALSVASSVDAVDILDGFRVLPPNALAGDHASSNSVNYTQTAAVTGTLVYLGATNAQRQGCTAFNITNTAIITGNIVLLDWDLPQACGSAARANNAAAAGAKGVILAYALPALDIAIAGNALIPETITPQGVGDALKAQLAASNTVTVVLNLAELKGATPFVDWARVDTVSSFSARGPRRGDNFLKPDIAAPGQSIFSVSSGSGNQGSSMSGTSMATPHAAGAMALLRQLHPSWTVEELKALAMNTAWRNLRSDNPMSAPIYSPARAGSGRIDLPDAAESMVVAYNQGLPGVVNVSFGAVEVLTQTTLVRSVRVVNKGNQPVTYRVAYEPVNTIIGVNFAVAPAQVVLPAYGVARVTITMTANAPMDKPNARDVTVAATQVSALPRDWLVDASGYLTLVPETSTFGALLSGLKEVPPYTTTEALGMAWFTYTASTRQLNYTIDVISLTNVITGNIYLGYAGINGGIEVPLTVPDPPTTTTSSGVTVLTAQQETHLLQDNLYVNIHTASRPAGEIRGQIDVDEVSPLRVAVYAAPRQAARVLAQETALNFGMSMTATYHLTGTFAGSAGSPNYPDDIMPLMTNLELKYAGAPPASPGTPLDKSKLKYVGVASDYLSSTNTLTNAMIYFGVASWGKWSTPTEVEFDVQIDTNNDGAAEYILYNAPLRYSNGDPSDTFLSFLYNVAKDESAGEDYINGTWPSSYNTNVYNTNVMVLPVAAASLGLTTTSQIHYRVVAWNIDYVVRTDVSSWMTYDVKNPGLNLSTGPGIPMRPDLPGTVVTVIAYKSAYLSSGDLGVLLLHHHNTTGATTQVLGVNFYQQYLPIVRR